MKTLITHPNFSHLGEELTRNNPLLRLADIKINEFNDTWPEIRFKNPDGDIRHNDVIYIGDYSTPHNLFLNKCVLDGIILYVANKVSSIVPYFPVGTNERITKKGDVPTAKTMANIIDDIPSGAKGKSSVHIFDIHDLRERFYFDDKKVTTEIHTTMDLIKNIIPKDMIIVFPDEGAKKRFSEEFIDYKGVFCSKTRKGDERIIHIEGDIDLSGKEVIIIDDLISSGGTILNTSKKLKEFGAKKVNAFAAHGVFTNDSYKKLSKELDMLYTTDTIPLNISREKEIDNMQVLSIKNLIKKQIIQLI